MSTAWDRIAETYDANLADGAWMRPLLRAAYARTFPPGARVLDLGCGTGLDAAWMTQRGIHITGVDVSAGMLARAHQRVPDATFIHSSFETLRLEGRWQGAYSAYAALNTLPDIQPFAELLIQHVHGPVLLHGTARRVGLLKVGDRHISHWPVDPIDLYRRWLQTHFRLVRVEALGLWVPTEASRIPVWVRPWMGRLERPLRHLFPRRGRFFLMELARR